MNALALPASALTALSVLAGVPWILRLTEKTYAGTRERIRDRMEALGMPTGWLEAQLRIWRLGTVALPVVMTVLGLGPLGLLCGFLCHRIIPHLFDWRIHRFENLLETQAAMASHQLAGQLRAGANLLDAVESAARQVPKPMRHFLEALSRQAAQGAEMVAVLEALRRRVRLESITILVVVLKVALENGGPLADILERITHSLQEMDRIRRKRDTDTASGRMIILTLAIFPLGFIFLANLMDPNIHRVMVTMSGQIILVITGLITYFSVLWGARILKTQEL